MWTDNETDRDFVNFTGVADTVAEIILGAEGEPVSIGVSGEWGTGKSTMIRLIRRALATKTEAAPGAPDDRPKYLFVEFNAWLYQGYDDARAALMEVIATALAGEAEARKTGLDKTTELLKRINVLRLVRLTAGSAAALSLGLPPVGLLGEMWSLLKSANKGGVDGATIERVVATGTGLGEAAGSIINPKLEHTPPKEIQALRNEFSELLAELGVTLVVLIDDLDRCLPTTTISTLEAIRLFLFLPRTAFVIAADDAMIKHAVRQHFQGVDNAIVTSYFDKLIQVPVRVPPLGTQEVRAYLIMLFVDRSDLQAKDKETIRTGICTQLARSWQGARVDRAFLQSLGPTLPQKLVNDLETADRLAPLMAEARDVRGNPRLIKRFLNALSIRRQIAARHSVTVDDSALVKMLLFERCGEQAAYRQIAEAVNTNPEGEPAFLAEWESKVRKGEQITLSGPWEGEFPLRWLELEPALGKLDLRGILYLGREHMQVLTPADRLTSDGAAALEAIIKQPSIAESLASKLKALPLPDRTMIMGRLLVLAGSEQRWGAPPILKACIVLADQDPAQAVRLAAFLDGRPHSQLEPSIVPLLSPRPWAHGLIDAWASAAGVSGPVKNAIKAQQKG